MLDRTQFLATGLIPVAISTQEFNDECSICMSLFTTPVKISACGHIFDKPCIEQWLRTDGRNTCPMCKCKLCELDSSEDHGPPANLREQVGSAMRASRIGEPNAFSLISTYYIDTANISRSAWQRATAQATFYLGQNHRPIPGERDSLPGYTNEVIAGVRVVRTEKLAPHFLAMGNLIPALARAAGRNFDDVRTWDWVFTLKVIWHELKHNEGKKFDVLRIADSIVQNARKELSKRISNVNDIEFLQEPSQSGRRNECREDLFLLLHYVAFLCWRFQNEERPRTSVKKVGSRPSGKGCIVM